MVSVMLGGRAPEKSTTLADREITVATQKELVSLSFIF
jgi:hypothetical protein